MTDRYTKTVLTVIAMAMVGLLAAQITPSAHAQIARTCSGTAQDPCYIRSDEALAVYVRR